MTYYECGVAARLNRFVMHAGSDYWDKPKNNYRRKGEPKPRGEVAERRIFFGNRYR